ncbi:unnamed protein product [Amoebophrya sp. A120]|nr:unnamed protein product [Amoebophrya sp. A120]|eukprot:GSA120T00006988001.1
MVSPTKKMMSTSLFVPPFFLLACLLFSGIDVANAERTWLDRFSSFPPSKTLEVVHFVTVNTKYPTEISLVGPVRLSGGTPPPGLGLAVVPHARLAKLSQGEQFCEGGKLNLGKDVHVWDMSTASTYQRDFTVFKPPTGGLYYILQTNCNEKDGSTMPAFVSGELSTISSKGYLPGEELPKLSFYLYLMFLYLGLLVVWGVWCHKWSDVLFKIHHFITVAIIAGLIEAACWYISLFHWNYLGHRWWSMMALASFGTVTKQGLSYGVLLLACLGLGVTAPRLDGKITAKVLLLVGAFIFADGIRQMALLMQDRVVGVQDTWKIILLVTPGSFFVSLIYVWILHALQETIGYLNNSRQMVKAEVYQNLRLALVLVVGIAMALVGYETIVVRRTELAQNWRTRYIFTDVLSHVCFAFLLTVIMYLWRPSERSVQMAYSQQLESQDTGDKSGGIQMSGQQIGVGEDFQSVEVEIGEEEEEDFDFKKSMEESLELPPKKAEQKMGKSGKVPDVLE